MNYRKSLEESFARATRLIGEIGDRTVHSGELADIPMRHLVYLRLIAKMNAATVSALAEALQVTKPTVTITVQTLVNQGYVEKVRSAEDRRVNYLALTEKGRKVQETHDSVHRQMAKLALDSLNEEEIVQLVSLLDRIFRNERDESAKSASKPTFDEP